jgi:NADPH-dependent 2,4-dienoyl-CoA reductase/sulfur reductase-like enzyme
VDIEQDKAGEGYVIQKNNGKRIIPTIKFADGPILVEPSNAELAAKLRLKTTGQHSPYDLIPWHRPPGHVIIGGGPTGLTAAHYTAREGIDTLVMEGAALARQVAAQWLDNVPGFAEGLEG